MKRSRERPATREVDAPVEVPDDTTRPIHTSLEQTLEFEALRRHSQEEAAREAAERTRRHRRTTIKTVVRKTAKAGAK